MDGKVKSDVKTERVSKTMAQTYDDLFERRQESDYVDFISFEESQVRPRISQAKELVDHISSLVHKKKQ